METYLDHHQQALAKAQEALENQLIDVSEVKELDRIGGALGKGRETQVDHIRHMISDSLFEAKEAVLSKIEELRAPGTLRSGADARKAIDLVASEIGASKAALIGLTAAFKGALHEDKLAAVIRSTGLALEGEAKGLSLKSFDPDLHLRTIKRSRSMTKSQKMKAVRKIAAGDGWEWKRWGVKTRAHAASIALTGAWASGLVEFVLRHQQKPNRKPISNYAVVFTQKGVDALSTSNLLSCVRPPKIPMVCEPKPWTTADFNFAPYMTPRQKENTNFNRRNSPKQRQVFHSWGSITDAADVLGQVKFKMDQNVVAAVRFAEEHRLELEKFPNPEPEPLVFPEDYEDLDDDQKREIRAQASERRKEINQAKVDWARLRSESDWIERLSAYGSIYLPHSADWRGRLYPIGDLHHQREDRVRSLFRFVDEPAIQETGAEWLLFHFSNCASGEVHGKLDKASKDERIRWARANIGLAKEISSRWQEVPQLWTKGIEKPFAFIQAAFEVASAADASWSRDFLSGLPVGLDGTNSGLQHYSAIMRAKDEGCLVNLVPMERPADVYNVVAKSVEDAIRDHGQREALISRIWPGTSNDAEGAREIYQAFDEWLEFGVTRSTVKRQVMTYVYSAKLIGFADQIREDLMKPLSRKVVRGIIPKHPFSNDGFIASKVMASLVWDALQQVIKYGSRAMHWLRSMAGILADNNVNPTWETPLGAIIVQETPKSYKEERVELYMSSEQYRIRSNRAGGQRISFRSHASGIHKAKAKDGIGPNFIHSHDAAHLQATTLACKSEGINSLMMIHDQFSAAPGHTQALSKILRREFVSMYEDRCPLAEFRSRCASALGFDVNHLPAVPEKGDLDLNEVLNSEYFFS